MDSDGDIMMYKDIEKLPRTLQEDFIPIPDEQLESVQKMSKNQRKKLWKKLVFTSNGKYDPHQGSQEKKRRLKQLQKGMWGDILKVVDY